MGKKPVLIPFVNRKDLTDECIALINEEWPRSDTVRKMSLERSSNLEPPMAFVLLDADQNELLGFARFLHIFNYFPGKAALFETVIIKQALRGQGFGRIIMDLLKNEAKKRGYELLILCTIDKQMFYEKCGYTRCKFMNLVTTITAQSSKLAETMRFDKPIPIDNEEISKKNEAQSSSTGSSNIPKPPPALIPTNNNNIKNEEYLFCYI